MCLDRFCDNLSPSEYEAITSFPSNEGTRQRWLQVIPINVQKHSVVCSRHFMPGDFVVSCSRKALIPNAVPSIFPVLEEKTSAVAIRQSSVDPSNLMELTVNQSMTGEPSCKRLCPAEGSSVAVQTTETSSSSNQEILRRKVKILSQRLKRRDKKLESFKELLNLLKNKCTNFDEVKDMLTNNFSDICNHLNTEKGNKGVRYTDELKQFALSLYFYSPKAYLFMRNHISLPHPATLRRILSTKNCNVGFMEEVIEYLRITAKSECHLKDVALIFDAMSIKSEIIYDKNMDKIWGYVDFGGIVHSDSEALATEVLVFQIVSFRRKFKCPIGYFLINKISANVQAQLILTAIRILHSINITVRSLTCDGTISNLKTYEILGCEFQPPEMVTSFKHPLQDTQVHCIFDPPHMIKLARNIFAETNLYSETGKIDFNFVKKLHELQESEGLRLANKLCNAHINFFNKKMNVKLATQLISASVADALDFLKKSGHLNFQGNEATVEYIRYLDRVFDLLNAKDPFGKGFKSPLLLSNANVWKNVLDQTRNYLQTLKIDGKCILNHKRKMAILGLIIDTFSFKNLAIDFLEAEQEPLRYFLPYKCSQDHIEMFFSCIRAQGGNNDNPNALQFRYALRKLLYRNSVTPSVNANCTDDAFELNPIFEFRSVKRSISETDSVVLEDTQRDAILMECLENTYLSDYKINVLHYIAGSIVNKLLGKISCEDCKASLISIKNTDDHDYCLNISNFSSFTTFIDRGGLKHVSKFAFEVVKYCEKMFATMSSQLNSAKNISRTKMLVITMQHFSTRLHTLVTSSHPLQSFLTEDCHEMQLVKLLTTSYLNLRIFHYSKLKSMSALGNRVGMRQKLHKTILFSNV